VLAEPVMAPLVDPGLTSVVAATTAVGAVGDEPQYLEEDDDEPKSSKVFLIGLIILLSVLAGMLYLLSRQFTGDTDPTAKQVEVPDVVGETVADAQRILKDLGFDVTIVSEANEDQPAGRIFAQDPAHGQKVDEGSAVKLKVSAGAEAIPVPNVVGSPVEQAKLLLTGEGFTVKVEEVVDEEAPVGEVVDQEPGPNEEAARGSEVTLSVSKGPADRPVPNVVGKTVGEASNLLGQAGFTANQTSEASTTVEEGRVIRTDPPADTVRPKGSSVTVVVSTGPPTANVPAVECLLEANAVTAIESAGFTANVTQQDTTDPSEVGRVISQDPAGNSEAEQGTEVNIVVGQLAAGDPPDTVHC
jgi:eukaryotic-like serine/threonine-protein kinase